MVSESNALVLGGTGANAVKVGIGTATPAYTLDAAGTIRSSSGGFMFPDGTTQTTAAVAGGTITGVTAGTGLTGGGTSGNVTLNINTATIPQLSAANSFTGTITAGNSGSSTFGVLGESNATTGQTYGVGGLAQSPSGYGVWGLNDATAGGAGVYGSSVSTAGYGVEGVNTSTAGTGVYGTAPSFGVQGIATGTGTTVGVYGTGRNGVQGNGTANGVSGNGTAAGSTGVYGTGQSYGVQAVGTAAGSTGVYGTGSAYGLQAVATNTTSPSYGVYTTGNFGLWGVGTQYGVYSVAVATGIAGTYGVYGGNSAVGAQGNFPFDYGGIGGRCTLGCTALAQGGVWADTDWNGDANAQGDYVPAFLATADANLAALIVNNSAQVPTLYAHNESSGGTGAIVFAEGTAGSCTLTGGGDAACTGVLKSVVATKSGAGAQRVETYSVQSAENWFEDAGTAQLVNGAGRVDLESVFGKTVNTGVEYHVFLTPDGDCKGLYVSAKTASGFEVRELGGGTSNIAFEYRIMAKRVGYENVRLADAKGQFGKQLVQNGNVPHRARPSADLQSRPQMPTPPAGIAGPNKREAATMQHFVPPEAPEVPINH